MTDEQKVEIYGADAQEWLNRWDSGRTVWSIEMGGLGPGYEQCIHITCAEILRHLLKHKYDSSLWKDEQVWTKDRHKIEEDLFKNEIIDKLGLSGAQWGAALSLAIHFYRDGIISVMDNESIKDRHIQVNNTFPRG